MYIDLVEFYIISGPTTLPQASELVTYNSVPRLLPKILNHRRQLYIFSGGPTSLFTLILIVALKILFQVLFATLAEKLSQLPRHPSYPVSLQLLLNISCRGKVRQSA